MAKPLKFAILSLAAGLTVAATAAPAQAQVTQRSKSYPLVCKGWGANGGDFQIRKGANNRSEMLWSFIKPSRRKHALELRAGECSWPDRAFRGAELRSRLFMSQPGDLNLTLRGKNLRSARIGRGHHSIDFVYAWATRNSTYTLCVTAGRTATGEDILKVSRITLRGNPGCY